MSKTVALITQPMRSAHCLAYLTEDDSIRAVIVTSDVSAFTGSGLPSKVELRRLPIRQAPGSFTKNVVAAVRRRVLRWARGGSALGTRLQQVVSAIRRTAGREPSRPTSQPTTEREQSSSQRHSDAVSRILRQIHEESPITRVVVFDLFDLPSAVEFVATGDVAVSVR